MVTIKLYIIESMRFLVPERGSPDFTHFGFSVKSRGKNALSGLSR
jgi:hypothetical protein